MIVGGPHEREYAAQRERLAAAARVAHERLPLVYVAGPYTKPSPMINVAAAVHTADQVLALGAIPVVPHLTHLWHELSPKPYEAWLRIDFQILARCDVVLRMAGESPGADREVAHAGDLGISVVTSMAGLEGWLVRWGMAKA